MKIKRQVLFSLGLILVTAMVLTACGTDTPPDVMETEEVMETKEVVMVGGIPENVGVYALSGDIPSLDPPYMLSEDTIYGFNVYETLTRWSPSDGIVPVLAETWDSNDEGTEWTFKLREGVTFHDGTTLTAEDVKASLDRNIAIGMVAYDFIGIDSIEVVDDLTVKFVASEPRNMPLILSASYGMFIYTAEAAAAGEDWFAAGGEAGTGPYMLDTFDPGSRTVIKMYEDYWGGWKDGQFTTVILEVVEDPTVRDQKIRSGEADITMELPFDSLESLQQVDGLTVTAWQPLAQLMAVFDYDNPPLDNLDVRKALAYSFPYDAVKDSVFLGYGTTPSGVGPTSLWNPPSDFPRYDLDIEMAETLLAGTEYTDGFELNVAISAGAKETLDALTLWQGELTKLGITLNVQQLSSGAFWDYAYTPDQTDNHIFMVPASGDVPSPYAWTIIFTSSPYGWFPAIGYANDAFDDLVFGAWALEATDADAAHDMWVQAQRILYDDAASIFVIDYPFVTAYQDDLVGFEPNPPYGYIVFWYDLMRAQ